MKEFINKLYLSIFLFSFFVHCFLYSKPIEAVELLDKIAEFLKSDLPEEFHFPKFKEIKEHLIMATVNGKDIVITDLKSEMDRILPMRYHRKIAEDRRRELLIQALDNLIVDELYFQEAKRQNISVKGYVKDKIEEIKRSYVDIDTFFADLKMLGVKLKRLHELIEKSVMIQKLIKKEDEKGGFVTNEELLRYYESNKERFVIPEKRRIRSISIIVPPESEKEQWEDAEKRIEEVKQLLQKNDFSSIAARYSDDQYRSQGGDMGTVHQGVLMRPVDNIVFSLRAGEMSGIIGTLYGFQIIKVEEIIPQKLQSFGEINKDELRNFLQKVKIEERRHEWTRLLKRKADIKIIRYQ